MIKYLLPYGIVKLYSWYKNKPIISKSDFLFDGIFKNFEETKATDSAGFITNKGIAWALNKSKKQFENSKFEVQITDVAKLSILLNLLTKNNTVEVYDIGGGAGHTYFNIYYHLRNREKLYWNIFEQSQCITEFSKFIVSTRLQNISIDNIEKLLITQKRKKNALTLLHIRSALHYFEKPFHFLRSVMQNSDYVFLSRMPTSNEIPTFVTKQKIYSTVHPCWFFNLNEIINFFEENNYQIIEIWNETEKCNMENFPTKYRLDYHRGILCKRYSQGNRYAD